MAGTEKITEVKVQVARVEERLVAMGSEQKQMSEKMDKMLTKLDDHTETLHKYKHDRNWVIAIFSVLYTGLVAWVKTGAGK